MARQNGIDDDQRFDIGVPMRMTLVAGQHDFLTRANFTCNSIEFVRQKTGFHFKHFIRNFVEVFYLKAFTLWKCRTKSNEIAMGICASFKNLYNFSSAGVDEFLSCFQNRVSNVFGYPYVVRKPDLGNCPTH